MTSFLRPYRVPTSTATSRVRSSKRSAKQNLFFFAFSIALFITLQSRALVYPSQLNNIISAQTNSFDDSSANNFQSSKEFIAHLDHPYRASEGKKGTDASCLPWVLYDKPPKTGSTALRDAIHDVLFERRSPESLCANPVCIARARSVCNGSMPERHILGHMEGPIGPLGKNGLYNCLRSKNFYAVTSIREPPERWVSRYFFIVHTKKVNLHGVSWNDSFDHFMHTYPDCVLHHYYDGLGAWCESATMSVSDRIKNIVERYDEVIELGYPPAGDVERRISKLVTVVNEAPREEGYKHASVNMSRLDHEWALYRALKRLRGVPPERNRVLCSFDKKISS